MSILRAICSWVKRKTAFRPKSGRFGLYDVYDEEYFVGTVLAHGPNHAIEQLAKEQAYERNERGEAIGMNPNWGTIFSYTPMSPEVKASGQPFNPRYLSIMKQNQGTVPEQLHPTSAALVSRFSEALTEKMLATQKKYGRQDDWTKGDWMNECREQLLKHIEKGDPLDVAIYAAFLWHHGQSTNPGRSGPDLQFERKKPEDTEGGALD